MKEDPEPPKVCVAICTWNRADTLELALVAALDQDYPHCSVIVLDNASDDATPEMVGRYLREQRDGEGLRYIRHPENIGGTANGNFALKNIDADFLVVTHDDDIMDPEMIGEEARFLLSHPEVAMVSTNVRIVDSQGKVILSRAFASDRDVLLARAEYLRRFAEGENLIVAPTVMFRVSVLRKEGFEFNAESGPVNDVELWLRINERYPIATLRKPLYSYRKHPGQDSRRNWYSMHNRVFPFLANTYARAGERSSLARLGERLFKRQVLELTRRDGSDRMGGARLLREVKYLSSLFRPSERTRTLAVISVPMIRLFRAVGSGRLFEWIWGTAKSVRRLASPPGATRHAA